MHDPLFTTKKKKRTTQWTKSAYEMKSSWVVQPKFRSSGGLCTAHRCGIHWSKIDILQACNKGLEQLPPYGSDFFFFFDKHSDLIEYAGTTIICNYDSYGCILVL